MLFRSNEKDELLYIDDNLPEEQKAVLEKLLGSLSIEHFLTFISNIPSLISLGQQTNPIHPFNTFEFFLSTEERIEKTKRIYHKTGLQPGFEHFKTQSIKGFCYFLKERHKKNELLPNLEKFCEKTKKDITRLQPLKIGRAHV